MIVTEPEKIEWQGTIVSIQPRTTVWRYSHYNNLNKMQNALCIEEVDV